jgi:uncharacterized membrane protein
MRSGAAPQRQDPVEKTANQAGDAANRIASDGKEAARSLADQVKQGASERLESQKTRASDNIAGVARAFRDTSSTLRQDDQAAIAGYVTQAAEQLDRVATYLQQRDIQDLLGEAERFARRQPALFVGAAFGLGFLASRFLKSSPRAAMGIPSHGSHGGGQSIFKSVEVDVPVRTVYNQWTQFEEFPRFMEGVEAVRQLDDKRLHWKAKIAGKTEEWDAVIIEQVPDRRIAWRSTTGARNDGAVTFFPLGSARTRVQLRLDVEPQGPIENLGVALGLLERRVEGDLNRFKEFIEGRRVASGAWRGEVRNENVIQTPGAAGTR